MTNTIKVITEDDKVVEMTSAELHIALKAHYEDWAAKSIAEAAVKKGAPIDIAQTKREHEVIDLSDSVLLT